MNSAVNLGGIFIVLDLTALAQPFAQIINIRDRTLGDRGDGTCKINCRTQVHFHNQYPSVS